MENVRTVLLADSGEESRLLLRQMVESTGEFTVVGATGDGLEALKLCDELRPDLVLSEVALPNLDGLGLLKALQERQRRPQVIMVSAFCSERTMAEAVQRGAFYFMAKPLHHQSLLEQMRLALNEGKRRRTTPWPWKRVSPPSSMKSASPPISRATSISGRPSSSP